jgi:hypothetical protein
VGALGHRAFEWGEFAADLSAGGECGEEEGEEGDPGPGTRGRR